MVTLRIILSPLYLMKKYHFRMYLNFTDIGIREQNLILVKDLQQDLLVHPTDMPEAVNLLKALGRDLFQYSDVTTALLHNLGETYPIRSVAFYGLVRMPLIQQLTSHFIPELQKYHLSTAREVIRNLILMSHFGFIPLPVIGQT